MPENLTTNGGGEIMIENLKNDIPTIEISESELREFDKWAMAFLMRQMDIMEAVSDELEKKFPKGDGRGYRFDLKWKP